MTTLEQIKNEFTFTVGFKDWRELFLTSDQCFESFEYYENQVMKIYAMECLKLASENCHPFQQSITNENNIIK